MALRMPLRELAVPLSDPSKSPQIASLSLTGGSPPPDSSKLAFEELLFAVAVLSAGSSGRALRKLPVRAHAFYLQRPVVKVDEFVAAMHAVIVTNTESDSN